jgi:hypothetical protein
MAAQPCARIAAREPPNAACSAGKKARSLSGPSL